MALNEFEDKILNKVKIVMEYTEDKDYDVNRFTKECFEICKNLQDHVLNKRKQLISFAEIDLEKIFNLKFKNIDDKDEEEKEEIKSNSKEEIIKNYPKVEAWCSLKYLNKLNILQAVVDHIINIMTLLHKNYFELHQKIITRKARPKQRRAYAHFQAHLKPFYFSIYFLMLAVEEAMQRRKTETLFASACKDCSGSFLACMETNMIRKGVEVFHAFFGLNDKVKLPSTILSEREVNALRVDANAFINNEEL